MKDDSRTGQIATEPRPRSGLLRAFRNAAVFALALSAACVAIRASLPFPKVPGIYEKYLHFSRTMADYDVLFIGSSRVYRAIIPQQFDASVAAATGETVRSFNLAYDGVQPPESYFLLRQILALHPPKLRWVFVEASPVQSVIMEGRPTRRLAYWHDLRHTWFVLEAIAGEAIPLAEKWSRWSEHCGHAFNVFTNSDAGAEWLRPRFGLEKPEKKTRWDPPKDWAGRAGYAPFVGERQSRLTNKALARYRQKISGQTPGPVRTIPRGWKRELNRLVAEIRGAGAQPVFVITPSVKGLENYSGYPHDVPLFRFQDPMEFPALFDPAVHWDHSHLNDAGARILTDLVSARFDKLLRPQP